MYVNVLETGRREVIECLSDVQCIRSHLLFLFFYQSIWYRSTWSHFLFNVACSLPLTHYISIRFIVHFVTHSPLAYAHIYAHIYKYTHTHTYTHFSLHVSQRSWISSNYKGLFNRQPERNDNEEGQSVLMMILPCTKSIDWLKKIRQMKSVVQTLNVDDDLLDNDENNNVIFQ